MPEDAFRNAVFDALDHRRHLNHRALARAAAHVRDPAAYMAVDARSLVGIHHGDITQVSDGLLRQVARRCGLQPGDLLAGEVKSFPTAASKRVARWTLRDAGARRGSADLVVASGVVTPDELLRED